MYPNDTTKFCECGCGQTTKTRYVHGHYAKTHAGTLEERFWAKVDRRGADECWNWQANKSPRGYGVLSVNGKQQRAHRVSYNMHKGEIPSGMIVCHTCDNPSCVNPNHLWLGTPADNMHDRDAKGRNINPAGEAAPRAKLTEQQAREIRQRAATGKEKQRDIAAAYNVSQGTVAMIATRKIWRHLD